MSKRIPQSFIDEVLAKADIIAVIERYLPLKKAGSNYSALCPFHNEKSPSFTVNATKQFYYCFGCGVSGNAIGFIMAYEHLSFLDALEALATQVGLTIPQTSQADAPQADYQVLYDILAKSEQYYRVQLHKHPAAARARDYLKSRGLSENSVKHFGIGYAPPGWDNLLQYFTHHKQLPALLLKTGLLTENENGKRYDRFRERIMFPIRDRRGRVIAFGGRVLDDSTPKYLNSPESVVFHKGHELYGLYEARQANRDLKQLLVVEGYMDVIALAEHGIHCAVATLGTAITQHHLQKLLRSCQHIIFCFDGDLAGQKAAWKALEIALPMMTDHTQVHFMFMPAKDDPDSFIRQHGKSIFLKEMEAAASVTDFFLNHLSEQINLETLSGRAQLVATAMPYLQKMIAPVTKELMIEALAKITRTDLMQLRNWSAGSSINVVATPTKKQPNKPISRQTPIRFAIALLLQYPQLAKELTNNLPDSQLPGLNLLKELLMLLQTHPNLNTGGIFEHWRDRPELKYLMQLAVLDILIPESGVLEELKAIFRYLQQHAIEESIEALMVKANQQNLTIEEKMMLQKLLTHKKTGL